MQGSESMFEMFESNKTKCAGKKEKEKSVEQEDTECKDEEEEEKVVVEEEAIEEKESVEEEYYTPEEVAEKLGISITLLRNKLPEYNVKLVKAGSRFKISREDFRSIKRQRIVNGIRKLACKEGFELCEECMKRILE